MIRRMDLYIIVDHQFVNTQTRKYISFLHDTKNNCFCKPSHCLYLSLTVIFNESADPVILIIAKR